ncbi:MAG: hypothetical protein EKK57_09925, partial [Proteobacteria bacterium]
MKVFNINKLKFTLAGICGSVMLVGCVGENADNKSTAANSTTTAKSAQNLKDVNDEKNLWAAITGSDGKGYNSDIRFAIQNGTGQDVRFLGCDGDVVQFSTQFESVIPAGYKTGVYFLDNDPKKNLLDPLGEGVYKPESLEKYQFKFGTGAYRELHANNEQCYFSIYDASRGENMYFKMVNDVRVFNTYSAVFNDMHRPVDDAKKRATQFDFNLKWGERITNDIVTGAATTAAWYKLALRYGISEQTLYAMYADAVTEELFLSAAKTYNTSRALYLSALRAKNFEEAAVHLQELDKFFDTTNVLIDSSKGYTQEDKIKFIKNFRLTKNNAAWSENGTKTMLNIIDNDGRVFSMGRGANPNFNWSRYGLEDLGAKYPGGLEGFTSENWSTIVRKTDILHEADPQTFPKIRHLEDLMHERSIIHNQRAQYAEFEVFKDARVASSLEKIKQPVRGATKLKNYRTVNDIVMGFTNLAFLAVDWFVFQPLLEWTYNEPGYGTFNTGIVQLSVAEVTDADAAKWNATHDNKIEANTEVLNDGSNDSVASISQLKFKQKGNNDTNSLLTINLSKVTTPWMRIDPSLNPYGAHDPFLGDVSKIGDKKGSSVFKMSLSNSLRANQDIYSDDINKLYFGELGLSQLANSNKLPAPEVTVVKSSVASNGGLKSTH